MKKSAKKNIKQLCSELLPLIAEIDTEIESKEDEYNRIRKQLFLQLKQQLKDLSF